MKRLKLGWILGAVAGVIIFSLAYSIYDKHKLCLDSWWSDQPVIVGHWENITPKSAFNLMVLPPKVNFDKKGRYQAIQSDNSLKYWASGSYSIEGNHLMLFSDLYDSNSDLLYVKIERLGCDIVLTHSDADRTYTFHYRRMHNYKTPTKNEEP